MVSQKHFFHFVVVHFKIHLDASYVLGGFQNHYILFKFIWHHSVLYKDITEVDDTFHKRGWNLVGSLCEEFTKLSEIERESNKEKSKATPFIEIDLDGDTYFYVF